ncbi:unnamed protein product [Paramecium sonneborni]|uniref:Uncharacterized protein n=1 Tax=Paramecium sonneborni TaxID=65129 RepID=A0A8S1N8L2_9CILI|nr:unnamed protein product [Paramecium sonneborni]
MMSLLITGFIIGSIYGVSPDDDKVILPGWGEYKFSIYSGYIPIDTGLMQMSKNGSYEILPFLSQSGIRMLIYSGDQDAIV